MQADEIRKKFQSFFSSRDHIIVPSSSLIPENDPTLLFTNAGMNQFKDFFLGNAVAPYKRACSTQKAVRAGGKHNDLDNVGPSARHHTFFEMLGNFSFGDYFKKEAISFAWELLTKEFKIPENKLFITVHHSDDEAIQIWHKHIGIPLNRIFKKGEDNFWQMGEFGPCGPSSEIFYDHGPEFKKLNFQVPSGGDILDDDLRYVEIWNLVFMQFSKDENGTHPLPKPCIDTGAGIERLSAVLQGVYWNYDTDLFEPIFKKLKDITGKDYHSLKTKNIKQANALRVVADHIRSSTMLITDGVLPGNEGRNHVLRRIIRRGVRFLRELDPEASFSELVPSVFEKLGEAYPQNLKNESLAKKFLKLEEEKFAETLDLGMKYFENSLAELGPLVEGKQHTLSGQKVFQLYDTYGFPPDLTEIIAKEKNISIDWKSYEEMLQKQKNLSKLSWKGTIDLEKNRDFFLALEKNGPTSFIGYTSLKCQSKLLDIISDDKNTNVYYLIFDQTPFYGEGGGQIGDSGSISLDGNILGTVINTVIPVAGLYVHIVENVDILKFKKEKTFTLEVNSELRKLTAKNHTATHLLQAALIHVLGGHIKQAGSSVAPERLRFDFTHPSALTKDEISQIEKLVNEKISFSEKVTPYYLKKEEALKKGATALFGEKYGEEVRIVEIGNFSMELCGGTHVENIRDIELFCITSEQSLSSGVRRIEAITSKQAKDYLFFRSNTLASIERLLSLKASEIPDTIGKLQEEINELKKKQGQLNEKLLQIDAANLFENPEKIGKYLFKSVLIREGKNSDLKKLADNFISKHSNAITLIFEINEKNTTLLIKCNKDLTSLDCLQIFKTAAPILNAKGGGKKDMVQGSTEVKDIHLLAQFTEKTKILLATN